MPKIKMLTIPVSPEFYAQFRLAAAKKNQTIAAYGRVWLERAVSEPVERKRKKEATDVRQPA